jgi:predicted enzyme related to lactoylglutathione lyase
LIYPKTDTGDYGYVAEFEDLEGNCIALHMIKQSGGGANPHRGASPKEYSELCQ